jgi:glycosyltransferase involved in cell wall biosynthesis
MTSTHWAINGRFLTRPMTGVDRFARHITAGLLATRPHETQVLIPRAGTPIEWPMTDRIERGGRYDGNRWEQTELSGLAADRPLLNLCNMGPILRSRQWVVIHDAATFANPSNYSWAFRAWYAVALRSLVARSRGLATVSRFSADQLMHHLSVRAGCIDVVPESGEHILDTPADLAWFASLGLDPGSYVLAVGSQSSNKNVSAVARAMQDPALAGLRLVAAGGANRLVFGDPGSDVHTTPGQLLRTGYVSDGQLRALYENALCFAFPSLYEGFGLPPLEAMTCSCPVLVSHIPPLLEVCKGAALLVDPQDPTTIASQIKRLLGSSALQQELQLAGRERAALYTWSHATRAVADAVGARLA